LNKECPNAAMKRKNDMPAILYPEWKIVKKFNTIGYSGGTDAVQI
jgi:hypothetical protein